VSCLTTVCEQIGQGVQRWQLGALRRCTQVRTPVEPAWDALLKLGRPGDRLVAVHPTMLCAL